jgi:N-methylhydantoinase B
LLVRGSGASAKLKTGVIPSHIDELAGTPELVPSRIAGVIQHADDVFEERWSGSGGFGDPLNRAPDAVAEDVRAERITEKDALMVYAVEIEQGRVDEAKTTASREAARARRSESARPPRERLRDIGPTTPVLDIVGTLTLVKDARDQHYFACGHCGQLLSAGDTDYRHGCLTEERSPLELGEIMRHDGALDDRVVVHFSYCPGCLTTVSAETILTGTAPSKDYELAL